MSRTEPTISVIIPCYNAARTLGDALDSVFAQTAPPIEAIVIDDASTDHSVAVAESFGPRVRVLKNPLRGPGAARHVGVLEAKGTYIAFVDADDLIEPTKHEKQLAILQHRDRWTIVHTGGEIFFDDPHRPPYPRTGGEQAVGRCTSTIFERNPVCGASCMIRRDVILDLGNYEPSLFGTEDYGMSLIASTRCTFVYLDEPLYRMRRHTGNVTNRKAHMAYHHWLAQEVFRQRCPHDFAALPATTIQQSMIAPVIRAAVEAYWARHETGYRRLLKLAHRLAPDHPEVQMLWSRRWISMAMLRTWDQLSSGLRSLRPEVP